MFVQLEVTVCDESLSLISEEQLSNLKLLVSPSSHYSKVYTLLQFASQSETLTQLYNEMSQSERIYISIFLKIVNHLY